MGHVKIFLDFIGSFYAVERIPACFYVSRGFFSAVLRYVGEEEKEELVLTVFPRKFSERESIFTAFILNLSVRRNSFF